MIIINVNICSDPEKYYYRSLELKKKHPERVLFLFYITIYLFCYYLKWNFNLNIFM